MATQNNFILDASVIIKWFIDEPDSNQALAYLNTFQNGRITIIAPSLLFYELGNILVSKKVAVDMVGEVMTMLLNLGLESEDIGLRWFRRIYQNAAEYSITFYDAAYITLLQKENCQFITADKKLFEKVHKIFSGIKLLSD